MILSKNEFLEYLVVLFNTLTYIGNFYRSTCDTAPILVVLMKFHMKNPEYERTRAGNFYHLLIIFHLIL